MGIRFRVENVDPTLRNRCAMCALHRSFHLATTDHSFVPGDLTTVECSAKELMPGDTIAAIPKQRDAEVPLFWVYRRR